MPSRKLKEHLDRHRIKYFCILHSPAYTAQEIAALAHITGRDMAKTVMLNIEGKLAMAVLPANRRVVLSELKEALGAEKLTLANEEEFKFAFPDCEIGAMPPFGNLYGMEVFVASTLATEKEIAFNAGNHIEVIKMAYSDFDRLVQPKVINFTA